MEKFITAAGCALRIADIQTTSAVADLPPILLLHGYLESLDVWEDFAKSLSAHTRVIAIDIPGHGISEVKSTIHSMSFLSDVCSDVLVKCGIDKAVVVGHSMGGYVALGMLGSHSEQLTGIVLFHSTPDADTEEKKTNREREIAIVQSGKKELLAPHISKCFAPENRARFADRIEDMIDQISLTEDEGITALLRGMCERPDSNELMRQSKVPQLMIFGIKDEYIPEEKALMLKENHPQAKTEFLENSGHMGFIEEPERSLDIVLNFLTYCNA